VIQLEFNFSGQMSLGDTSLLRIEPDLRKKRITFIGIKPGTTSVTVRDAVGDEKLRYLVTVTSDDLSKTVGELRDLIGDVEGIEIGIRGGKVFVGGQIVVPNDIKRVAAVLESFSGTSILRLIEMSPQTQLLIAKEMQEELQRSGFRGVTVKVVNKAFWVEGPVGSNEEAQVIQNITKAFLPEKIEAISSNSISAAYPPDRNAINFFLTIDQKQNQEEQQKEPTKHITEEFILYTFLGIFVIYIVDSFARVGKYVR
jgi:pilus assembly protein CpaC